MSATKPKPTVRVKPTNEADQIIGRRIAALRIARCISQTALGDAIGVSFQQVQKYESGRNRVGAGRLKAIADLLNVPVSSFFTEQVVRANPAVAEITSTTVAGALDLVRAYSAIADERTRKDVLALVQIAARLQKRQEPRA